MESTSEIVERLAEAILNLNSNENVTVNVYDLHAVLLDWHSLTRENTELRQKFEAIDSRIEVAEAVLHLVRTIEDVGQ